MCMWCVCDVVHGTVYVSGLLSLTDFLLVKMLSNGSDHTEAAQLQMKGKRTWKEEVEFVYKRRKVHSIPDILATAQTLQPVPDVRELDDFIRFALQRCVAPRISIFNYLGTPQLPQGFSLDNGVVLQEVGYFILSNIGRPNKRKEKKTANKELPSAPPPQQQMFHALYEERETSAVWWEARLVRMWTWPASLESLLLDFFRQMVALIIEIQLSDSVCDHRKPPRTQNGLADFCHACLRRQVNGAMRQKKASLRFR